MGEQTTRVSFDAKTIRDLGRVIGAELAKALAGRPEPQAADAAPAEPVHIEPWVVFGPREQSLVAAYVDDAQQQRWVRVDREADAPKAWRKLYIARAAS